MLSQLVGTSLSSTLILCIAGLVLSEELISTMIYQTPVLSAFILKECFPLMMIFGSVVVRFEVMVGLILVGVVAMFHRLSMAMISPVMLVQIFIYS